MFSSGCGTVTELIILGLEHFSDIKALSTKLDYLQILNMLLPPLRISPRMLLTSVL